ncbi:MAG: ABC transporter permease [Chloroflexota bacterium]|jgi:putative ABC transport system permease protein
MTQKTSSPWKSRALYQTISRRVSAQPFLLFVVWLGFTMAVALTVSIPVYAESAGYRLLINSISENQQPGTRLPPFALIYKFGGASTRPVTYEQWQFADNAMRNLPAYGIDLPSPPLVRYGASEKLEIRFPDSKPTTPSVVRARIGFLSDIEQHIRISSGNMPKVWDGNGPIEVLVAQSTSDKNTILLDDVFLAQKRGGKYALEANVKIVGIWQPRNDNDLYWFTPAAAYSDVFFVPEQTWQLLVNRPPAEFVEQAGWYAAYDGSGVQSSNTPQITNGITTVTSEMSQLLPGVELFRSPLTQLQQQQTEVRQLTVTLLLFGVPLISLLLAFVWQIAGLLVARQELEIAVLRSRGVTRLQLLGMSVVEGGMIALFALLAGIPLSLLVARAIGLTQSFLRFGELNIPEPQLLNQSWLHGGLIAAFAIPAITFPALRLTQNTIVTLRQSQARQNLPPWIERYFIDVLLFIPAWYGYQQLSVGGSIAVPGLETEGGLDDPFRNPLLLLAPALFIGAATLFAIRLFPRIVTLVSHIVQRTSGIVGISALRQLARNPGSLRGPTLLLILTISLATFTASMARTLDQYSVDRANYRSGADYRLLPSTMIGTSVDIAGDVPNLPDPDLMSGRTQLSSTTGEQSPIVSLEYLYVPVSDFAEINGIEAATLVAPSKVDMTINGTAKSGVMYAIDPTTFASVVADTWRNDYTSQSLGELINSMNVNVDDAIISQRLADELNITIGDRFEVVVDSLGSRRSMSVAVANIIEYMPTLYNEGPYFVLTNYEHITNELGGRYMYEIWLRSDGSDNLQAVQSAAFRNSLRVLPYTPTAFVSAEILQPQRQGLFGLLSIGFVATGIMSMIGMLAYILLTLRKRSVEFGVLRAIGISQTSLRLTLALEQLITIGFSTLLGLAIGVITSALYLPFLKVSQGVYPETPPFLVVFAGYDTGLIAIAAIVLMGLIIALELYVIQRMRIGEAVKLGEAV